MENKKTLSDKVSNIFINNIYDVAESWEYMEEKF